MHNARTIILLIVIFLILALYPVWNGLIRTAGKKPPQLELPLEQRECVMPVAFMKENHMTLLKNWRDTVVRDGDRTPVKVNLVKYEKSLSKTCFKCHVKKTTFCDRCHDYLSVAPPCWDCHYFPKEKKSGPVE
jgi:hypothetical protein